MVTWTADWLGIRPPFISIAGIIRSKSIIQQVVVTVTLGSALSTKHKLIALNGSSCDGVRERLAVSLLH